MDTPLPSNEAMEAFSRAVSWQVIEEKKRKFNAKLRELQDTGVPDFSVKTFEEAINAPIITHYDLDNPKSANVILTEINGQK